MKQITLWTFIILIKKEKYKNISQGGNILIFKALRPDALTLTLSHGERELYSFRRPGKAAPPPGKTRPLIQTIPDSLPYFLHFSAVLAD